MRKKKRGRSAWGVISFFLAAVLLLIIAWSLVSGWKKLSGYGDSTTIGSASSEAETTTDPEETTGEAEQTESALPQNTYDTSGFYEENGIRYYKDADVTGVPGIDVSAFQPEIDWAAVKNAGIEFVMIRVGYRGYSTGKLALDDCFLSHIQGAQEAGLGVGVYFFSQALTEEEAIEEANFALTWIEGYNITYPVVFDWEEVEGQARTDEMNMLTLTACAKAFCDTVQNSGYEAAIYFNLAYGYEQYNLTSLKDYTFWLAEYTDTPTFYHDFQMWQYSNSGTVPGIEGNVDLNIWFEKFGSDQESTGNQ